MEDNDKYDPETDSLENQIKYWKNIHQRDLESIAELEEELAKFEEVSGSYYYKCEKPNHPRK